MIEINLIPDVKQELLRAQAQRNIVISASIVLAIAAVVIVILVASYVFGAQKFMMDSANKTIDKEYATLSSVEDLDRLLTIQNQLDKVSQLNANKNVGSRLYGMLNVIVPSDPHNITISSVSVDPIGAGDEADDAAAGSSQGAKVTIEGQTVGSYATLEVFEKTIAAAVIEYNLPDDQKTGDLSCGDSKKQCRRLAEGDGDRALAVHITETSFGEDQDGNKTLRFVLNFTVVPEFLSNVATDVTVKIGANGNVTDSYLNTPRAIFRDRADDEGSQQ